MYNINALIKKKYIFKYMVPRPPLPIPASYGKTVTRQNKLKKNKLGMISMSFIKQLKKSLNVPTMVPKWSQQLRNHLILFKMI